MVLICCKAGLGKGWCCWWVWPLDLYSWREMRILALLLPAVCGRSRFAVPSLAGWVFGTAFLLPMADFGSYLAGL